MAVVAIIILIGSLIFYDVLFSKPLILKGIIVKKIFVPAKNVAAPSVLSYGRYKSYDYTVTAQQHQQWIAFVEIANGQILKVNCHTDHYEKKQVGDTLHFKEYTGELLGIDYFSHNEEDQEIENSI
jgi:hypothetical protein